MLFNSEIFLLIFLPITLIGYYIARVTHYKIELVFLSALSLFFYAWHDPKWLLLLLSSIMLNYIIGFIIHSKNIKYVLEIGILLNLFIIAWFKYKLFLLGWFLPQESQINFIIPLAISFFTFQQISYLIDIRDKIVKPLNFLDHVFYVSFFPQLIAGPIVLVKNIIPQIKNIKNKFFSLDLFNLGIFIFFIGLFKKVYLADNLAPFVDLGFTLVDNGITFPEAWSIVSAFALQLYFDFSGYSEMAVGLGLLFGLRLPVNFNVPFKATSMIDFWKRWHITVTNFFMLYVYSPLSLYLNRRGSVKFSQNYVLLLIIPTFFTFFLSGLWHGANWKFVYFGLINGLGLIINHLWKIFRFPKLPKFFAWLLTIILVLISFVFFRANNTEDALKLLSIMFNPSLFYLPQWLSNYLNESTEFNFAILPFFLTGTFSIKFFSIFLICTYLSIKIPNIADKRFVLSFNWRSSFYLAFAILFALSGINEEVSFIYFQF